jgi:hypothetical protein
MRRREFIAGLGAAAWPVAAHAHPPGQPAIATTAQLRGATAPSNGGLEPSRRPARCAFPGDAWPAGTPPLRPALACCVRLPGRPHAAPALDSEELRQGPGLLKVITLRLILAA